MFSISHSIENINEELVAYEQTEATLAGRYDELELSLKNDVNAIYNEETFSHIYRLMMSYNKCSQKIKLKILD